MCVSVGGLCSAWLWVKGVASSFSPALGACLQGGGQLLQNIARIWAAAGPGAHVIHTLDAASG